MRLPFVSSYCRAMSCPKCAKERAAGLSPTAPAFSGFPKDQKPKLIVPEIVRGGLSCQKLTVVFDAVAFEVDEAPM